MTWRVNQVENILLSVFSMIGKGNGLTLDGDPPLALDVHIIQDLILEVSLINQPRILNETVCKGRFSVINVCDDAKVSYVFHGKNVSVIKTVDVSRVRNWMNNNEF